MCEDCADMAGRWGNKEALGITVDFGHIDCLKKLLETTDANTPNAEGDTPLVHAARRGHLDLLTELIKAGADVNMKTKNNWNMTPLLWAAVGGHKACIEVLIKQGAELNTKSRGKTVLSLAVEGNHTECVDIFIAAGADVNKPNGHRGSPPLMVAAQHGFDNCMEKLLKAGADVNRSSLVATSCSTTPLVAAVIREYSSCRYDIFLDKFLTPQRTNCIKLLLSAGAEVNKKDKDGILLTVRLAEDERFEYLELLLNAGLDANTIDVTYFTLFPCRLKCYDRSSYRKCVKLLLRLGAKVNVRGKPGLKRTTTHKQWEFYMMLSAAGEAVNPDPHQGIPDTPSHGDPKLEMSLKHLSREAIRKHLLQISRVNLFVRVSRLGLPSIITDYLLYNVKLDEDDDDDGQ